MDGKHRKNNNSKMMKKSKNWSKGRVPQRRK